MIPQEFFDWGVEQWWGLPTFIIVTFGALIWFSWMLTGIKEVEHE